MRCLLLYERRLCGEDYRISWRLSSLWKTVSYQVWRLLHWIMESFADLDRRWRPSPAKVQSSANSDCCCFQSDVERLYWEGLEIVTLRDTNIFIGHTVIDLVKLRWNYCHSWEIVCGRSLEIFLSKGRHTLAYNECFGGTLLLAWSTAGAALDRWEQSSGH